MRRVASVDLEKGPEFLESGFAALEDPEVYDAEQDAGILCSLGEDWSLVNLALTGEQFPRTGAQVLPVLGGHHIATLGSPLDVLLCLSAEEVAETDGFLSGCDFESAFARHRAALGHGIDWPKDVITAHFEHLRTFYATAARAGQAVVKRMEAS